MSRTCTTIDEGRLGICVARLSIAGKCVCKLLVALEFLRTSSRSLVVLIRQVKVPDCALVRQHDHPYHTTRASIPLDRLSQCAFDEPNTLLLRHPLFPVRVTIPVDVRAPAAPNGVTLLMQTAPQGNRIDLPTMSSIIPSDDHPRAQRILIRITQLLEHGGGGLGRGWLVVGDAVHAEIVLDDVCDGLRVGGRAGAAAPDCVVDLCELVGDAVGDVGACCGAGVGAEDDALVESYGHTEGVSVSGLLKDRMDVLH